MKVTNLGRSCPTSNRLTRARCLLRGVLLIEFSFRTTCGRDHASTYRSLMFQLASLGISLEGYDWFLLSDKFHEWLLWLRRWWCDTSECYFRNRLPRTTSAMCLLLFISTFASVTADLGSCCRWVSSEFGIVSIQYATAAFGRRALLGRFPFLAIITTFWACRRT